MIIGSKYIPLDRTESTNTYASTLLGDKSVPEGTIVYANFQSAGRGQKGNSWESEYGKNLLFSIILFPDMIRADEQFLISIVISLGICDYLQPLINDCSIKWPNDIYYRHDKIAGILIENSVTGNTISSSVAGIGLNLNQDEFSVNLPNPSSLKKITGTVFNTVTCLRELAGFIDKRYKQLISGDTIKIKSDYISSLLFLNEWHNFETESGLLHGKIVSVTDSGELCVEDSDKKIRYFGFKEIEFFR